MNHSASKTQRNRLYSHIYISIQLQAIEISKERDTAREADVYPSQ